MKQFDFKTASYTVSGMPNMTLDHAMRLWKTKFPSYEHFRRAVIKSEALKDFGEFMQEMWDDVTPISTKEAFEQKNAEMRRLYFDCIGVIELFKAANPKLLDKQVIKKKRMRWDEKNDPYEYEFEDIYELYSIDPNELYKDTDDQNVSRWRARTNYIAVRCWCTSTQREYWIYVPEEQALKEGFRTWQEDKQYDAVKGIAWTIRIDIKNPEKIYRQGDIIIAKEGPSSTKCTPYHLSKEQYLSLMYSET
jgi:hypothetical protein